MNFDDMEKVDEYVKKNYNTITHEVYDLVICDIIMKKIKNNTIKMMCINKADVTINTNYSGVYTRIKDFLFNKDLVFKEEFSNISVLQSFEAERLELKNIVYSLDKVDNYDDKIGAAIYYYNGKNGFMIEPNINFDTNVCYMLIVDNIAYYTHENMFKQMLHSIKTDDVEYNKFCQIVSLINTSVVDMSKKDIDLLTSVLPKKYAKRYFSPIATLDDKKIMIHTINDTNMLESNYVVVGKKLTKKEKHLVSAFAVNYNTAMDYNILNKDTTLKKYCNDLGTIFIDKGSLYYYIKTKIGYVYVHDSDFTEEVKLGEAYKKHCNAIMKLSGGNK